MPQRMVGRPISSVMLVTLLTSELVTTSAPGPPLAPSDKGEDQIAHARAVGHDERAEDGALHAAPGHGFQPPDHQEGGGHEEAQETPRRPGAGAVHPCGERIQRAQSGKGSGPRQAGFGKSTARSDALFPLTSALSLRAREEPRQSVGEANAPAIFVSRSARLPLPKGEGRGEGEGTVARSVRCRTSPSSTSWPRLPP